MTRFGHMVAQVAASAVLLLHPAAEARSQASDDNAARQKLLAGLFPDFGVPASPAFAFLSGKPENITHLTTPKDLTAHVGTVLQGWKLQSGAAFDLRPLTRAGGSLSTYQGSKGRQALFRTVISLGTAATTDADSRDVVVGVGLRVPLIDRGDPRADRQFVDSLEKLFNAAANTIEPPAMVEDLTRDNEAQANYSANRLAAGERATEAFRTAYARRKWNALRVDVGLGATFLAAGGDVRPDSLSGDRLGLWTATSLPVGSTLQITLAVNGWRADPDTATDASSQVLGGLALRWFPSGGNVGLRAQASNHWAKYSDSPNLDDEWQHYAIGIEFRVPGVGGWWNLAYGGDASRRDATANAFTFTYAVFKDRVLKP